MNTSIFHSALAEPIGQFVQYKRALNRKYRTEAAALTELRHSAERNTFFIWGYNFIPSL